MGRGLWTFFPVSVGLCLALALPGCSPPAARTSQAHGSASTHPLTAPELVQQDSDTYQYHRDGDPVDVEFEDDNHRWYVWVEDHRSVFVQHGKSRVPPTGLCSRERLCRILDRGITAFEARRPDTHLFALVVRMNVIRGLWGEILHGLRSKMSRLPGTLDADSNTFALQDAVNAVLDTSPSVAAVRKDLAGHGYRVTNVGVSEFLVFHDSLYGHRCSQVAGLPDAGLQYPGIFEFDLWRAPIKTGRHLSPTPNGRDEGASTDDRSGGTVITILDRRPDSSYTRTDAQFGRLARLP